MSTYNSWFHQYRTSSNQTSKALQDMIYVHLYLASVNTGYFRYLVLDSEISSQKTLFIRSEKKYWMEIKLYMNECNDLNYYTQIFYGEYITVNNKSEYIMVNNKSEYYCEYTVNILRWIYYIVNNIITVDNVTVNNKSE